MLPHETLLRPVLHSFPGKSSVTQTAGNRPSNNLGSLLPLSLRESSSLKEVVTQLSDCLRLCHRKNIEWLEPTPSHSSFLEYAHDYLISPILQLFKQLRVSEIQDDMFSHAEENDEGIVKVWFTSLDFGCWEDPVYPPTIFITPRPFPNLINAEVVNQVVSPILPRASSNSTSKVIFTDLKSIIVIHPHTEKEVQVEIVPLKDDLRAFRIIVTAYLLEAMPQSVYLNPPKVPEGKYPFWLPPCRSDEKSLTDEEALRTKHRHSDFNILKLLEDREAALQFFRWKLHVKKHVSRDITSAGDTLECTTNDFQQCHPPPGIHSKPIPLPTLQHTATILRPNPLGFVLRSTLSDSKRFTIKLGRALGNPNFERAIARVHLCAIETIDGRPVDNCPELVMKIFDDRFMEVFNPYNEEGVLEDDGNIDLWFHGVLTAEWHVRGELTAFEKMVMAQGSLIPYFYGAHKFRLANNHEVFGVLMEYVDAPPLDSGVAGKWSEEHQSQLMTSIRHGLRVLQYSDISQHDWHGGQILCKLPLSSSQTPAHAVLIDFSATTQTIDLNIDLSKDDYGHCMSALTYQDATGIDYKWVCEYWDRDEMKREVWDAFMMTKVKDGYVWTSQAVDPYKFVYEELDLPGKETPSAEA